MVLEPGGLGSGVGSLSSSGGPSSWVAFSLCPYAGGGSERALVSCKGTNPIMGPTLMTSSKLNDLLQAQHQIASLLGLGFQRMDLGNM